MEKKNNTEKAVGVLPSDKWLKENGYGELVKVIHEHPEKFAHIQQNKEQRE